MSQNDKGLSYDLPGSLYSVTLENSQLWNAEKHFHPVSLIHNNLLRKMSNSSNISLPYKYEQTIMPCWRNLMVSVTWVQIPHI